VQRRDSILLVEDDPTLRETLAYNLTREGYEVKSVGDGQTAIDRVRQALPDIDGLEVCRAIRRDSTTPILVLSARDSELDTVLGLEFGADQYVTKPFELRPLLARIKALLRRATIAETDAIAQGYVHFGGVAFDPSGRRLYRGEQEIPLTLQEYELLNAFVTHAGQVLSRDHLLESIWGYDFSGDSRTVDVHVRWLREKIEDDPGHSRHIVTVRGIGYRFEDGAR
jgi:DNA-binding response OmpR family regulator